MTAETVPLTALERAALLVISAAAVLLAFVTPPFQVPDEPQHFSRALLLADGGLIPERRGGTAGAPEPDRLARFAAADFPYHDAGGFTRYGAANVRAALTGATGPQRRVFVEFANVANYSPSLYLPQAAGIVLGKAVGAPPLVLFLLARLCNLASSLALLWLAVRVIPFGRPALLAVAALPTVSYQAASVSPDASINALGLLAIALSLRWGVRARATVGGGAAGIAAGPGAGSARRLALLAVAAPLGLCKGLYSPLLLAGLRPRRAVVPLAALVLAAAAFVAWNAHAGDQPVYQVVSRRTGQLVTTASLHDQLRVVLHDPVRYVRILLSSMGARSPIYALQIVGRFGWGFVVLPLVAYPLALVVLAAGVLASTDVAPSPPRRAWWIAIFAGTAVLIETALYLTGTPLGADYIQGTQGRYFLPALPLLLLALTPRRGRPGASLWLGRQVACTAILQVLAVLTVADAFWLHGFTSYHGLPPVHGARGMMRAAVLPSSRW